MGLLAVIPMGMQAQEGGEAPVVPASPDPVVEREVTEAGSAEEKLNKRVFGRSDEESYAGKVVVLKIGQNDLINGQSFKFMRRTLRRAEEEGAKAIVFKMDTPGGDAMATKNLMREMVETDVRQFAFIDPEAGSAGALIAAATNEIYMAPSSLVGSAALVSGTGVKIEDYMRKKLESFFDAHVRAIVGKRGHNIDVVRAMMFVDDKEDRVFGAVTVRKGDLLALNAEEAAQVVDGKPLFAKAVVESEEELLAAEGLAGVPVVVANQTAFERLAWWVKLFSPILILVGLGAGYLEMKAPGFGLGGAISLTAFSLFFFGNFAAGNLAGYELAALFVLGIILILVEIFLIPGTGVAGILGGVAVVSSLFLAMVDELDFENIGTEGFTVDRFIEMISYPSLSLALGLMGGVVVMLLLMRFLPRIPYFGGLLLKKELTTGAAIDDERAQDTANGRMGWTGETVTDLRPTGKAEFDGQMVDVATSGEFVDKGSKVRIVSESGMGVVVKEIEGV